MSQIASNNPGAAKSALFAMSFQAGMADDVERALELATNFLGLSFGIVSRVEDEHYMIKHVHQPEGSGLAIGQVFELGATYCAMALDARDVVAIGEMRNSQFAGHPCYATFGLESYIGVPLIVEGEVYGTLSFSDAAPRARPWTETDRQLVRLVAHWVESTMVNRRLNRRLARALGDLDRVNVELRDRIEDLDQFANIASHDLQAPLRKLVAFSELLEEDLGGSLPANAAEDLEFIKLAAGEMQALIRDLLEFSRTGRAQIEPEEVSLDDCLDAALGRLQVQREESGAEIERRPLPSACGQRSLLTQVFQNLIGNALKFRRPGVTPRIVIDGDSADGVVTIRVQDNGIGIDPRFAAEVFAPFRRLRTEGRFEGTGLGLAICKKIVNRHGGQIAVEPCAEQGSRFTFTLELDPVDG